MCSEIFGKYVTFKGVPYCLIISITGMSCQSNSESSVENSCCGHSKVCSIRSWYLVRIGEEF